MVVKNDPTLMFTNAGMNQFKDYFLGNSPITDPRVSDSQKCLRVSGKHNDLEEVGHDTYHHTMFEMLGNWSFGDYFKKEAIEWACELLFDVYKLPKERIYATVYEGSESDGVAFDQEAYDIWKTILPESHILKGNKKDNFWEMGEIGPCGPCSEIHFDLRDQSERDKVDGAALVNKDNPQVIEIWNLVFMQYNRVADGSLVPLPHKHVDTGMGFERLCMILQGKRSNYDTDVFQPLITRLGEISGKRYGEDPKVDIAMRVISDHLRAIAFSIADGQIPSNVKAGYVIRRILRRAVRYGYTYLGMREPFICRMVPTLVQQMGKQFPELAAQEALITKVIEEEENSFLRTLSTGINMLEEMIASIKAGKRDTLDGSDAFVLYDTYGFPIDLTELICREQGIKVDIERFQQELAAQKNRSRSAAVVDKDDWVELLEVPESKFIGYDTGEAEVRIARYRRVVTKNHTFYQLVFDQTPFYGTSGGQVGDNGYIESPDERIYVTETHKENGLTVHIVESLPEGLDAAFHAVVDMDNREKSAANHTATHLLQAALKKVLGNHVEQKGSLVSSSVLRFDFSHFNKMTDEEIYEVERLVNAEIRKNHPCIESRDVPIEEAQKSGAMMLFGEKYGDSVRTIRFGDSLELCGGIHAYRTGSIGSFRIISEGAISAGIRRIEAVTGAAAVEMEIAIQKLIKGLQSMLNTPSLSAAIEKLLAENNEMKGKVEYFTDYRNNNIAQKIRKELERGDNGYLWYVGNIQLPVDEVKNIALRLYNEYKDIVFVNGSVINDKPSLVVMVGKKLVDKGVNAGTIVREAAKQMQGGGGGQPHLASAGGKDVTKVGEAISKAVEMLKAAIAES